MPVGNSKKVKLIRQGYIPVGNYFRRNGSVHSVTRCTLLASPSLLLSSPVIVHSSCQVLNSSTVPRASLSYALVSMFTINSDIFCFFCFAHPSPARSNRCPIILWWSVGSMVSRIPILQMRTAVVGVKQRLASFQHLRNFSVQQLS